LVRADDSAADPFGSGFGLVERDWNRSVTFTVKHCDCANLLKAEMRPTPKPAKNLPATNNGMAVAAVWRMTPKVKTPVDAIKPHLRPRISPIGAALRAPKKVPAERMETIVDFWVEVMLGRWSFGSV
jgi:hypothetical protein